MGKVERSTERSGEVMELVFVRWSQSESTFHAKPQAAERSVCEPTVWHLMSILRIF